MKKTYPLVITFLLLSGLVFGQSSFRFANDTLVYKFNNDIDWKNFDLGSPSELMTTVFSEKDGIKLTWEVVRSDMPKGWEINICDNLQCHENPNEEFRFTSLPISKDEPGFFQANMSPDGNPGKAIVQLWVYEEGNPSENGTLTFIWDLVSPVGLQQKSPHTFTLFPNPCQSELRITFAKEVDSSTKIKIYNLVGQEQRNIDVSRSNKSVTLDLRKLNNGTYLVQFLSSDGKLHTQRFSKKA